MEVPKVIDPPGMDVAAELKRIGEDVGVCACPSCDTYYASAGNVIECKCGFAFPVDWWHEYSRGNNHGLMLRNGGIESEGMKIRENNPYYRQGLRHPVEDCWEQKNVQPWPALTAGWDPTTALSRMDEMAICERCGQEKEESRKRRSGLCIKCQSETECRHRCSMMEEQCKAGVSFESLREQRGENGCLPCYYRAGMISMDCEKFEPITVEETEAKDKATGEAVAKHMLAMGLVVEVKQEHKGKDWRGVKPCPVCSGKLHMPHSSYNGHVWGKCETDGCLAWME